MDEYIGHLNNGDFEAALELVHNPGDVTADSILLIDELKLPNATTSIESFNDDVEAQAVQFDMEGTSDVGGDWDSWRKAIFVKVDGDWLLKDPMFLTNVIQEGTFKALGNSTITTKDGVEISPGSRYVAHTNHMIDVNVDFSGNDLVESKEFDAVAHITLNQSPFIPGPNGDYDQHEIEFKVAEPLHSQMEKFFLDSGKFETPGINVTTLEFPEIEHCTIPPLYGWPFSENASFTIVCGDEEEGVAVGLTEVEYPNGTYRSVEDSIGMERVHEPGTIETMPAVFHADFSEGEIVDGGYDFLE